MCKCGWSWSRLHGTDPADQLHPSCCIPIRRHYHPASSIVMSGHALQASVPAAWCGGDHPLEHRLGFPDSHQNRLSIGRRPPLLQHNWRAASRLIPVDCQVRNNHTRKQLSLFPFSEWSILSDQQESMTGGQQGEPIQIDVQRRKILHVTADGQQK